MSEYWTALCGPVLLLLLLLSAQYIAHRLLIVTLLFHQIMHCVYTAHWLIDDEFPAFSSLFFPWISMKWDVDDQFFDAAVDLMWKQKMSSAALIGRISCTCIVYSIINGRVFYAMAPGALLDIRWYKSRNYSFSTGLQLFGSRETSQWAIFWARE